MLKKNKKYKAKSIQVILIRRLFCILVIVLVFLGIYQYSRMKGYLFDSKIELLESRFKNIEKEVILATNTDELLIENTEYILKLVSGENICVAVINKDGDIIGETNQYSGIRTALDEKLKERLKIPHLDKDIYLKVINDEDVSNDYCIIEDENNKKQILILRDIGVYSNPSGVIQISTTIEDIQNILLEQIRVYIISTVMALIIIALSGRIILKYTLNPLKKLTSKLDNIDENQLDTRINSNNGQVEIDILANKFNNMFDRLEKSFEKEKKNNMSMKNFILDASHELRTPLTSIQGFIEVLQLGVFKDEKKLKIALENMMTESRRLSKLVNELLLLTKLEGNIQVELKRENINEIINELKSQLEILKKDRKLEINLDSDMYCEVNKDQIKQVIYNLFQNAINHTDEESGIINISTRNIYYEDICWVEVSIRDNGEGIPEEKIKLIFDRFYRGDKHRSRKSGGYGLGLSIVKRIIYNHNGKIKVESEEGKGSKFTFCLKGNN